MLKRKRDLIRTIGRLVRIKNKDTSYLLKFYRNLFKEKGLLNRDNPDSLLAEVYLNNMIYFGDYLKEDKAWRGNLNLVWGDILLERDPENGLEYLTLAVMIKKTGNSASTPISKPQPIKTGTQSGKLRAAITSTSEYTQPRVYSRLPALQCPVEAFKIFKARRPNNSLEHDSPFYLAPNQKSKPTSKTWYQALAMSCQRLDPLFYCLFKKSSVDLNSLATMTAEQQAEIVAAATATSVETNDYVVWKPIVKEQKVVTNHRQQNPMTTTTTTTNGYASPVTTCVQQQNVNIQNYQQQQQQQNMDIQLQQQNQIQQQNQHNQQPVMQQNTLVINGQTYTIQPQQQQIEKPPITRVPAQIQVQVQIQVMSQMQRQQFEMQMQQQQQHEQMSDQNINGNNITLL